MFPGVTNAPEPDPQRLTRSRMVTQPAPGDGAGSVPGPTRTGRRWRTRSIVGVALWPLLLAAISALSFGAGWVVFQVLVDGADQAATPDRPGGAGGGGSSSDGEAAAPGADAALAADPSVAGSAPGVPADGGSSSGAAAVPTVDPDGPHLMVRLDFGADPADGLAVLSGRMPPGREYEATVQAMSTAYGPLDRVEVELDDSLAVEPWMAAAPSSVPLLGLSSGGVLVIDERGLQVAGTVGQEETARTIAAGLELARAEQALTGPVRAEGLEITGRRHPSATVQVDGGRAVLGGEVPTAEVRDGIVASLTRLYGEGDVESAMVVADDTSTEFWIYSLDRVLELFQAYPAYEIRLVDGTVTGRIESDGLFPSGSAVMTDEARAILPVAAGILARDPRLDMTITGHTDASGSDADNFELSLQRAQAAVDALVAMGIDPNHLIASGRGERSPIATNSTPEGRASNRRVEFSFGVGSLPAPADG